jgi:ketosteroid isomerase-like protein
VSQENVEIVRKAFDAWDGVGVTAALAFVDPNAEMELVQATPDQGVIRGREAIGAYLTSVVEEFWESFGVEHTNYESMGQHHVLVDVRLSGRGRESGAAVEQRFAEAFEVRGGFIVRWGVYPDRPEALKAVGLEE